MKYLFYLSLLFIFEGLNAQTDSNNKEADLFYKDDNSNSNPQNNPVNKTNNTALQTKKYSFEKSNFSDFITRIVNLNFYLTTMTLRLSAFSRLNSFNFLFCAKS